ncbi:hypothetical protein MKX01_040893 [Papaver californicum]|nr:hypothetical protein MKX01_040893 [Papaver californicum]
MVRGKRRPLAALAATEDYSLHGSVESLDFKAAEDLHEDGNWVIVKKQRITIWIPPPSPSVHPTTALSPPRTNNRQQKSKKRIIKRRKILPNERQQPRKRSHEGELQNCDTVLDSTKDIQISRGNLDSPPNSMKNKLPKQVSRRTVPKGPTRLTGDESIYLPATSKSLVPDYGRARLSAVGFSPQIRVSRVLEADKNKKRLPTNKIFPPPAVYQGSSRTHVRSISCLNMGMGVLQQNQKMRAANLERKLEKAGGLSKWLISLGLGQFEQMFRMRNVDDKFQLLNLNMGKLKEMGAIAVGPRRKLMHAIDCLSLQGCTLSKGVI